MKKAILALVLLAVILALGIGEQVAVQKCFGHLEAEGKKILTLIGEDQMQEAERLTQELHRWWQEISRPFEGMISHNETKEVTLRIAELEGYIAIDDRKSAYATAAILVECANNLAHLLGFSWDTVV